MNQKEFKSLDEKFFTLLGEKLLQKDAGYRIIQTSPFDGSKTVGVYHLDSPNFFELYNYSNNGDIARWDFAGHTQTNTQQSQ